MNFSRRVLLTATAMSAALALTHIAQAQSSAPADWPNKPIKIIVGFPPGTAPDVFARIYSDYVSKK